MAARRNTPTARKLKARCRYLLLGSSPQDKTHAAVTNCGLLEGRGQGGPEYTRMAWQAIISLVKACITSSLLQEPRVPNCFPFASRDSSVANSHAAEPGHASLGGSSHSLANAIRSIAFSSRSAPYEHYGSPSSAKHS